MVGKLEGLIGKLTLDSEFLERGYITAPAKLEEAGSISRGRPLLNSICIGCGLNFEEHPRKYLAIERWKTSTRSENY